MKFYSILILLLLLVYSSQYQHVKIGAIFFEDEQEIEAAFTTAVNRMSRYDLKLIPIKRYATDDDSMVLQKLACDLIGSGVSAIFGPSSKATSDIVALICNSTGIPHILFDWSSEENIVDRRNHRFTINVAPSTSVLIKAYSDIINNYSWKRFTILYESDEALIRLQSLLQLKRIHNEEVKVRKFQRGDDYRVMWKNVRHQGERRVILDCPPDLLVDVMNSSIAFQMTGQFNHIFLTNLDTHSSGLNVLYTPEFMANITAVRIELNTYDHIEDTTVIPTLTFDAVQLFANAIRNILESQKFFEHRITCDRIRGEERWHMGRLILYHMKSTTEQNGSFITRNIQFNEWGERINFNLEVYRPTINEVIALWSPDGQLVHKNEIPKSASLSTKDYSKGRRLYRVATRLGPPYFMERKSSNNEILTGNARYEGYAVDLIHKLSEIVGFDYVFEPVHDNAYGTYNPETKEWNGIVRYLIDHKADIGICDLTITQSRRSVVDFTVPFMQLGISILFYKSPVESKNKFAFFDPFVVEVWMYMLTSGIVISLASILLGRLSRDEWENPHPCNPKPEELENNWDVANTSWLAIGSIMGQGCDLLPRSGPMRLVNGMWWFFALMMLNSYTANLAAFLTSQQMENAINSLEDLADQNKIRFGTIKGGSTSTYFSESNDTINRLVWSKMVQANPTVFTKDNNEGADRVEKYKGQYAYLMETTSMEYVIQRSCNLTQIGSQIGEKHYGIAVPFGSDYRSNLSVAILVLSERGDLFTLKKKWWKSNVSCQEETVVDGSELSIAELGGVFLILVCGILAAFVLGISEFLWNIQKIAVEEKITPKEALKSEIIFALKFWIKKKPIRTSTSSSKSLSSRRSSRLSSEQSNTPTSLNIIEK